jgi:hypothetical protein
MLFKNYFTKDLMKKFFVSLLAIVYLAISVGVSVNVHYCMGTISGWGIGHHQSKSCSKCGMEESKGGCCKDENKIFKINTDQKSNESVFQPITPVQADLPPSFIGICLNNFTSPKVNNPKGHPPTQSCYLSLHIRNCVYRI